MAKHVTLLALCACAFGIVSAHSHAKAFTIGASTGWAYTPSGKYDNGSEHSLFLGGTVNLGMLILQPEAQGSLLTMSGETGTRITGGARLFLGGVLQPGALAHIGYGTLGDWSGVTWDLGGLLDLSLGDVIKAGVHVIYTNLTDTNALEWLNLGIHAQLSF